MLTRLTVRNFRALEVVDVPLAPITAFVGPNSTGKTSLFRAIELVLGETWPSLRSFRIPQDFTTFDASRVIEIAVSFDPPYSHRDTHSAEHSVTALRVTCKPYKKTGKWGAAGDLHVDIDPLNDKGEVPTVATGPPTKGLKTAYGPLRVGTDIREHARVLFIDHRRSLAQHLPNVRGSVLGRLLQPARKEFKAEVDFRKAYEQAMDLLRTEQVKKIEATVADTAKRMLGFLGTNVSHAVDIDFGFSDLANPFGSLRLQYSESDLVVPGEELGLGIQSAIVVGIFEAFRQIGGDFGTLIIEEPEMYLHPQAQRYFYRLLCEMSDQGRCQIIYTTHSPIFADVNQFESIRLVRRATQQHCQVSYVPAEHQIELSKARTAFKLIRNKKRREDMALRFRNPKDPFRLVIVRDMWLTGFDAPSLHTMYIDKPMRGHGLMQTIARVNRVFKDKPGGLVVDYLGLADELKQALATYTESGGTGKAAIDQAEAVDALRKHYEICRGLFHNFDWSPWMTGKPHERLSVLPAAQEHILKQEDGKARLLRAVTDLSQAFALAVPHEETFRIRDDVGFFQAVRAVLAKSMPGEHKTDDELDHAIRQIISKAVVSDEIVDIFAAAGLKKPDLSILSDEFLAEVRGMPQKNLAVELLRKLLSGETKVRSRKNVVQAKSFAEMLEHAVRKYQNRAIEAAQVIEEMISLAKDIGRAHERGERLGLTEEEMAFYDALETNDSAVKVLV